MLDRLSMEMGDRFRRLNHKFELDHKFKFLLDVQKLGDLSSVTLKGKSVLPFVN